MSSQAGTPGPSNDSNEVPEKREKRAYKKRARPSVAAPKNDDDNNNDNEDRKRAAPATVNMPSSSTFNGAGGVPPPPAAAGPAKKNTERQKLQRKNLFSKDCTECRTASAHSQAEIVTSSTHDDVRLRRRPRSATGERQRPRGDHGRLPLRARGCQFSISLFNWSDSMSSLCSASPQPPTLQMQRSSSSTTSGSPCASHSRPSSSRESKSSSTSRRTLRVRERTLT